MGKLNDITTQDLCCANERAELLKREPGLGLSIQHIGPAKLRRATVHVAA